MRRTRHAGHCWRSKDELISDVLLWIPSHRRASVRQPARTYRQQLCKTKDVFWRTCQNKWQEKVREIHARSMTWWWWWWSVMNDRTQTKMKVRRNKNIILNHFHLTFLLFFVNLPVKLNSVFKTVEFNEN